MSELFHGPADRSDMPGLRGRPHIERRGGMWRVYTTRGLNMFSCPTFADACRAAKAAFAGQAELGRAA